MPANPSPSAEHSRLIARLQSIGRLDAADCAALAALPLRTRSVEAGALLSEQGTSPRECALVIEGLVCRSALTGAGGRQIVSFHIAGDMPDRDGLHLTSLDYSTSSVSAARVAFIAHAALAPLLERHPNVGLAFWRDSVIDGGRYRQWLTSVGRRTARQRVAHLICEVFGRMEAAGLADDDHFHFPVTQMQIGDALGLSGVHVNRTLQDLKQARLIAWKGPVVTILDAPSLHAVGDFNPLYLSLKAPPPVRG